MSHLTEDEKLQEVDKLLDVMLENEELKETVSRLEQKIEELEKPIEIKRIKVLQENLRSTKEENRTLQGTIAGLQGTITQLQWDLREEKIKGNAVPKAERKEIGDLTRENKRLEEQLKNAHESLKKLREEKKENSFDGLSAEQLNEFETSENLKAKIRRCLEAAFDDPCKKEQAVKNLDTFFFWHEKTAAENVGENGAKVVPIWIGNVYANKELPMIDETIDKLIELGFLTKRSTERSRKRTLTFKGNKEID